MRHLFDNDVGQGSPYIPRKKNWIGSAIGAVGSIAGGLASSAMTNAANANLDEENRDWQYWMWKQNNAYNHPLQQRNRLEQAGINPALAFQNGNTGVASQAQAPNQHTPADWSAVGTGVSQAAQYMLQASQVRAQNGLINSQKEAQDIENMTLYQRKIEEWNKLKAEVKKTGADTSWIDWQEKRDMALFDAYQKKAYAEIHNIETSSALNDAQVVLTQGRNNREAEQISAVIAQLQAAARSSDAAAALSRAQAGVIPNLSPSQRNELAEAFVNEALKRASAEEIAGFKFSGSTVEKLKQAVIKFLVGD